MTMEMDLDNIAEHFEAFWKIQRRKIDKALCLSIYREVTSPRGKESKVMHDGEQSIVTVQGTPEAILEGCTAYLWSKRADADKYILHPSRFLKKGRWMDQEETIAAMKAHQEQEAHSKREADAHRAMIRRAEEQQSKDRPFSAANFNSTS